MSNVSSFGLPFEGLELARFLLTLEQALSPYPGVRVVFVELDAADPDESAAGIEISVPRVVIERLRAPEDPAPPEGEEILSADVTLSHLDGETTLDVDLEQNAFVMPLLVRVVEDVLNQLGVSTGEDDEDAEDEGDEDDEEFDEEEEEDEDDAEEEDEEDEDEASGEGGESAEDPFEALLEVAAGAFGEVKGDAHAFGFTVAWEDPPREKDVRVRAFAPTVAIGEGQGVSWVAIESDVCPRSAIDPSEVVKINGEADFAISLDGDMYVMSTSFPAAVLEADLFLDLSLAVAEHADLVAIAIEETQKRARA